MLLRSLRSTAIALVLAASVVPLAACSGASSTSEPAATASAATTTGPLSVSVHGPAKRVADALATVPLRADQRATLEQMAKDADARMEPARKARADLMLAIADQVQAGTIDKTALQPKIDAVAAAHQAVQPQNRAAFEKLHDLLTPEQRVAFVNAMESHEGDHVHGQGPRGHMQKWVTELNLTQDQQDQIKAKFQARWQQSAAEGHPMMGKGHEMHEHFKAVLEAFKGDKFSMPAQDHTEMAHGFAGHMLGMIETALPILTPEQRTIAATKIRERAQKLEEEEEVNVAPATK